VNPPIQVESATWSAGGQLDWWVKEPKSGEVGCAVKMAVKGGSGLSIFVVLRASDSDSPFCCHGSSTGGTFLSVTGNRGLKPCGVRRGANVSPEPILEIPRAGYR
jgi:hypothetical protein